mgnify:CR=1 FL=1
MLFRSPAGDPRPISVTGGLGFAGGPGNAYVVRSIASMVEACRRDPGSLGLVTALGWYATKHAAGLYSTSPAPQTPRFVPRSVVVAPLFDWAGDRHPRTAWADTVVYELHVKGFTRLDRRVPESSRGTYRGLAHPAVLDHLCDLGVTAVGVSGWQKI